MLLDRMIGRLRKLFQLTKWLLLISFLIICVNILIQSSRQRGEMRKRLTQDEELTMAKNSGLLPERLLLQNIEKESDHESQHGSSMRQISEYESKRKSSAEYGGNKDPLKEEAEEEEEDQMDTLLDNDKKTISPQKIKNHISFPINSSWSKKMEKKIQRFIIEDYPFFSTSFPPARVGSYTCRDSLCSEFLQGPDIINYKYCTSRAVVKLNNSLKKGHGKKSLKQGECHFMDGRGRAPVALVSFPGSGNTWLRGLLEQATGICTGAVYCDADIRAAGFNGEKVQGGSVLVVKTHYHRKVLWTARNKPVTSFQKVPYFGAAVFLIRSPFGALVSEWHRHLSKKTYQQHSIHVGVVNSSFFGDYPPWSSFIQHRLAAWNLFFRTWVIPATREGHPLHILKFEDLKTSAFGEVKKILDFLGVPYSESKVKENLVKDFSTFKRKHKLEFEHFTATQKRLILNSISKSLTYLKAHTGQTFGIERYLHPTATHT